MARPDVAELWGDPHVVPATRARRGMTLATPGRSTANGDNAVGDSRNPSRAGHLPSYAMSESGEVSERWLIVLRALTEACDAEPSDSVPTPAITRELRGQLGGTTAAVRTLLRALRRHGYLNSQAPDDKGPVRWAPTAKGRSYLYRMPGR